MLMTSTAAALLAITMVVIWKKNLSRLIAWNPHKSDQRMALLLQWDQMPNFRRNCQSFDHSSRVDCQDYKK